MKNKVYNIPPHKSEKDFGIEADIRNLEIRLKIQKEWVSRTEEQLKYFKELLKKNKKENRIMENRFELELIGSTFVGENNVEHEHKLEWAVLDGEKHVSYVVKDKITAIGLSKLLNKMNNLLKKAEHELTVANGLYAADNREFKEVFRLNYGEILNSIKRI